MNHRFPSGPDTRPIGWLAGVGTGNRVTLGLGGGTLTGGSQIGGGGIGEAEADEVDLVAVVVGDAAVLAAVVVGAAGPAVARSRVVVVESGAAVSGSRVVVVAGGSTIVEDGTSTVTSDVPDVTAIETMEGVVPGHTTGMRMAVAAATRARMRPRSRGR